MDKELAVTRGLITKALNNGKIEPDEAEDLRIRLNSSNYKFIRDLVAMKNRVDVSKRAANFK